MWSPSICGGLLTALRIHRAQDQTMSYLDRVFEPKECNATAQFRSPHFDSGFRAIVAGDDAPNID